MSVSNANEKKKSASCYYAILYFCLRKGPGAKNLKKFPSPSCSRGNLCFVQTRFNRGEVGEIREKARAKL